MTLNKYKSRIENYRQTKNAFLSFISLSFGEIVVIRFFFKFYGYFVRLDCNKIDNNILLSSFCLGSYVLTTY